MSGLRCLDVMRKGEFDGDKVIYRGEKTLEKQKFPLFDIATASMAGNSIALGRDCDHGSQPTSPPPFMAGVADVEVGIFLTGQAKVIDYYTAVDCVGLR